MRAHCLEDEKTEVKPLKYDRCAKCGQVLDVASIYLPDVGEICLKCYGEYALNEDKEAMKQLKPAPMRACKKTTFFPSVLGSTPIGP